MKALEEFAEQTGLPDDLHNKLRQFLENNFSELFSRIDEQQLLQELPITLRDEVLQSQFAGLITSLHFIRDCENTEFMWAFVQALKKIKIDKGDILYFEGDFSEEIYFIKQGKVKLFAANGYSYLNCKDGQHFGEVEVFFREQRMGKAVA